MAGSFPSLRWAWPTGALDQLLRASLCPEESRASAAFREWLKTRDIDEVGFREHRLLAGIAERLGPLLRDIPEHPRLVGLQRQLWTRSRMAAAEAVPVLRAMAARGLRVMLLKGGARVASRPDDQRSRVAHDLDILVEPAGFVEALDCLFGMGWSAASGESPLCIRANASSLRAMNFFSGRFGDVDLHQWAYGKGAPVAGPESGVWAHAQPVSFHGVEVWVPSATDRLAMAISHSGLEAHVHSDWVVDCAQIIAEESVEWDRLLSLLIELRCLVPAQVLFGYLSERIGVAMPSGFLERLASVAPGALARIPDLLQAKPRTDWGFWSRLARGVVKQWRLRRERSLRPVMVLRGDSTRISSHELSPVRDTTQVLGLLPAERTSTSFELEITMVLPGVGRRLEFELNTPTRHLIRLRSRTYWPRPGMVKIRFLGQLKDFPPGAEVRLESRPGRRLREESDAREVARYGALPFKVVRFEFTKNAG